MKMKMGVNCDCDKLFAFCYDKRYFIFHFIFMMLFLVKAVVLIIRRLADKQNLNIVQLKSLMRLFFFGFQMGEPTGLTNSEARELCKEPDPSTKDFIMQQTMYRIKDPKKSLPFYTNVLGMRLLQKLDFPELHFTLYFLGYEDVKSIPSDKKECIEWTFSRKATIELTQLVCANILI